MADMRVCELAKELGRQNREVMDALKAAGVYVKSHMSNIEEDQAAMIEKKFIQN